MEILNELDSNEIFFDGKKLISIICNLLQKHFSSLYLKISTKDLSVGIKLEEILKYNFFAFSPQILNQFSNAESHWVFRLHPQQNAKVSLKIHFTQNGKATCFLLNPIFQNMEANFSAIKKQLEDENFFIHLCFPSSDYMILRSEFHIKKIETYLHKIAKSIQQIFLQLFSINHPGKYQELQNAQSDISYIYCRKAVLPSTELTPKNYEKTQYSSQKKNIKIFDYELEKNNIQQVLQIKSRVSIRKLHVYGKVLISESLANIEESVKKNMFSREQKQFYQINQTQKKSFLQHQIQTLRKNRNILMHKNIGCFYLRRSQNMNYMEKEVFSEIYQKQLGQFANKLQMHKIDEFDDLLNILRQLISVLSFLYDHHLIHRDIKPDNILIQNKSIRVIDIGGIINPKNVCLDSPDRALFSTIGYYYQNNGKQGFWNHEKFDMFGLGEVIKGIFFRRNYLAQAVEGTKFEYFQPRLREMQRECQKNPITVQVNYQDLLHYI